MAHSHAYETVDYEFCLRQGHHLTVFGSDKYPMKRSLMCDTCSGNGKTVMVAHGIEAGSFGAWRPPLRRTIEREVFTPELDHE